MFFRPDLYLAGFIVLILKEFTVNKWRNPTRRLCAVAMP
ncbi:type VI secretion lipoprotein/VasD, partial [Salmonella enterica]|nr:type VI secretion lipoprotein/VasD [Salmonella enterica subsp. enterica serovar Infantis]ECX8800297.1 type VI secretion lipoprotein/VasD [Salmonella enterica]NKG67153.1 type VI secretion lipoprotein/VasD [Salmonella enterica subsp. enterica serovar Infantis]